MQMDFASFYTDANGVLLRAWRIALSITSGGSLNAALHSQPSSETHAGRKLPSSTQWHRSQGPAQVHHESRELKVPSCWDRDKSSVDPLCRTLSLNVKFHFLHKETTSPRSQNPMDSDADANGPWNTIYLILRRVHTLEINFREMRVPDLNAWGWSMYLSTRRYAEIWLDVSMSCTKIARWFCIMRNDHSMLLYHVHKSVDVLALCTMMIECFRARQKDRSILLCRSYNSIDIPVSCTTITWCFCVLQKNYSIFCAMQKDRTRFLCHIQRWFDVLASCKEMA
jgi:hypothetical protein